MHLVREIRTYIKITTYPSRYCCTLAQRIVGFDLCNMYCIEAIKELMR